MLRKLSLAIGACIALHAGVAGAQPRFVNGLVIPGETLDDTGLAGASQGRLGFFSDIYYDPKRKEWWALSDRGPGGGVLPYATRLQRFKLNVDGHTGRISKFAIKETITFTDPDGLLSKPSAAAGAMDGPALNGLNPALLNGDAGILGLSFDPEGLVVHPCTGHFLVADEYGPSVYEFNRKGQLLYRFTTPANLLPAKRAADGLPGPTDFVAGRAADGIFFGRQDNRGFEGLAIAPDGSRIYAVLQDPLVNEPGPNNGRDGRNVRIVAFDSSPLSPQYGQSLGQYAYQLESQADVAARINAVAPGTATPSDPRQGRNIGVSAITAVNDHEFLLLERDNRGLGVDDPVGRTVTGSKRVVKIDITGATDVSSISLPGGDLSAAGIVPVHKSSIFVDLAADSVLPNGKIAEKWEGLAIGPRLKQGKHMLLAGNDNDFSVTQNASNLQFDVYVDFAGNSVQRDIDSPAMLNGVDVGKVPAGYTLLPGVLHAYAVPVADLLDYQPPCKAKLRKQ